jgi:hypothetical protein
VDEASVYVRLTPKGDRARGQDEIAAQLREEAKRIGGAEAALATGGFGNQILVAEAARGQRRLGAADALGLFAQLGRDLVLAARAVTLGRQRTYTDASSTAPPRPTTVV